MNIDQRPEPKKNQRKEEEKSFSLFNRKESFIGCMLINNILYVGGVRFNFSHRSESFFKHCAWPVLFKIKHLYQTTKKEEVYLLKEKQIENRGVRDE